MLPTFIFTEEAFYFLFRVFVSLAFSPFSSLSSFHFWFAFFQCFLIKVVTVIFSNHLLHLFCDLFYECFYAYRNAND